MFAQESVMDVQKQDDLIKEAFEIEAEEIGFCLDQLWGDYENPYENSDTALAFNLFKKGWLAKAQAVPEGFVLVPKEPTKDYKDVISQYLDELWMGEWGCDWDGFICVNGIDPNHVWKIVTNTKAMIEAQEQSHECPNP